MAESCASATGAAHAPRQAPPTERLTGTGTGPGWLVWAYLWVA
ncbi:MAG: hypothetical protein ACYC3A_05665 [Halothiobacillus sp.]